MNETELRAKLAEIGQEKVLRFWDRLDDERREKLARQIAALDPSEIAELVKTHVRRKPHVAIPANIQPVKMFPRRPAPGQEKLYAQATARGNELLRAGKVAAFLVAGGQGTRLGYDGPKGEFPITPIKNKPLFQVFAEQLRNWSQQSGRSIAWYIMTSDINDGPTREFFAKNKNFGYDARDIFFFEQGMMPAFDFEGDMLLAELGSLALSPDGHGGSLRALNKSGAVADMHRRGVEHLSYFQVDNPLVHCIDPLFLGLHEITGSEMSSKTITKAGPLEKVGNFVVADWGPAGLPAGSPVLQVIEYSDLPDELAKQTNADGSLKFNAGSIAIHALAVSFVERLYASGKLDLPWHRAEKKVAYVDASGNEVKPEKANAVKLEQFVFDAIPMAKNAIVFETAREEEFSPVKNAEGADSPATCKRDQVRRAARWLRSANVGVAEKNGEPAAVVEISPLFAATEEQLKAKGVGIKEVRAGEAVYLE